MKGQELKDFVKSNHKEFGGSMSNQQLANQAMCSNARISQIKKELIGVVASEDASTAEA